MLSDNVDFGKGPIQKGMITLNVAYLCFVERVKLP